LGIISLNQRGGVTNRAVLQQAREQSLLSDEHFTVLGCWQPERFADLSCRSEDSRLLIAARSQMDMSAILQ